MFSGLNCFAFLGALGGLAANPACKLIKPRQLFFQRFDIALVQGHVVLEPFHAVEVFLVVAGFVALALRLAFVDWRPEIYKSFLSHLFTRVAPNPSGIIAAGHAAGYVLKHFASHKDAAERLVLLSPTWRGPLPTMMGGDRAIFSKIARAFDPPVVGAMLYGLNVNRVVVGMMARGHVYADPAWLSGRRLEEKLAITRPPGARHASARFVSGRLDPFRCREEQEKAARGVAIPMLNVFSKNAPTKSRAEMEALALLPNVRTVRLPEGKLSFYEEFPEKTADVIHAFLVAH